MKEIELPTVQTYSLTVDTHNIDWSTAVDTGDGRLKIPLGNIVNPEIAEKVEVAKRNGGKILYAATSIEYHMDNIILDYFMGPFVSHQENRVMFESELLQSPALTYQFKKELLQKILNKTMLLKGKKRDKLNQHLKNIMTWRNAFAHGKIQHDDKAGCFIKYYAGNPKTLKLTDEFWDNLTKEFQDCEKMLKEIYDALERQQRPDRVLSND